MNIRGVIISGALFSLSIFSFTLLKPSNDIPEEKSFIAFLDAYPNLSGLKPFITDVCEQVDIFIEQHPECIEHMLGKAEELYEQNKKWLSLDFENGQERFKADGYFLAELCMFLAQEFTKFPQEMHVLGDILARLFEKHPQAKAFFDLCSNEFEDTYAKEVALYLKICSGLKIIKFAQENNDLATDLGTIFAKHPDKKEMLDQWVEELGEEFPAVVSLYQACSQAAEHSIHTREK